MRLQLTALLVAGSLAAATWQESALADEGAPWKINTDTLFYTDTDNVMVVSPQVAVHRDLDEDGGAVSARVVVDAVTAASVDVVSQATNRFSEVREELNLGLAKAFGSNLPSLSYRYSYEPDYVSHGIGVGFQRQLGSSDTTLGLGYDISLDTVGYTGTPTSAFSKKLTSHGGALSLTQVIDPKTLVRVVYTLSVQNGYMEKAYRFVPLFDQAGIDAARADGVKLNLSTFDQYRLPMRVNEEVPDTRIGHAGAVRLLRYIDALPGSFRLDYQVFADSWGVRAHTLESNVYWEKSDSHLFSVYSRFYLQQGADFWKREYLVSANGFPHYRTLDRDLSDYYTVTGGLRYEWKGDSLSAYLDGSAMETVYSDYLFLSSRLALIAQAGLHWQF